MLEKGFRMVKGFGLAWLCWLWLVGFGWLGFALALDGRVWFGCLLA